MTPQDILAFLGQTAVTILITSGVLVYFGKTWIENQFNRSLKDYEYQINRLLSRVSKIHEKEFEILPELWQLMHEALGHANALTVPYQEYPDLNRMSELQLTEFLETTTFSQSDKQDITSTQDKNSLYQERIYWYRLRDAKNRVGDFHNFLIQNSIFLSTDIKEKFQEIDKILSESLTIHEHSIRYNQHSVERQDKAFTKVIDARAITKEIEELVQKRLQFQQAG